MRKKLFPIFLALILCFSLLAGCGSSAKSDSAATVEEYTSAKSSADASSETPMLNGFATGGNMYDYEATDDVAAETEPGSGMQTVDIKSANPSAKVIYNARSEMQTIEFDKTLDSVQQSIKSCGGYVERSYMSGSSYDADYYGYKDYRSAELTVRVPSDKFTDFTNSLSKSGYVLYLDVSSQDVTSEYFDTKSRLDAAKAEHDRLVEMMEKADNVADMITIEQRMSEVQYQIDYYSGNLNHLDDQVNYSTITLSIYEVEKITEKEQTHQTYSQQLSSGFTNTLKGMGRFFKDMFRFIVTALPVLIILGVICVVVVVISRKHAKKSKKAKGAATHTQDEDK